MSEPSAVVEAVLRVLNAILAMVDPEPRDVEELLKFAPECSDLPVGELAYAVVQRVKRPSVI